MPSHLYESAAHSPVLGPCNIGALMIRIGFWCPLYYAHNKEHPEFRPLKYGGNCGTALVPEAEARAARAMSLPGTGGCCGEQLRLFQNPLN